MGRDDIRESDELTKREEYIGSGRVCKYNLRTTHTKICQY